MAQEHTLKQIPGPPEYRNSAGRLLRLLEMLKPGAPYYKTIASLYGHEPPQKVAAELKGELYLDFMQIVSSAYHQFLDDIEATTAIPDATKPVMRDGLSKLVEIVYPANSSSPPRALQDAEIAVLRMAGSMIPEEDEMAADDKAKIAESIKQLGGTIEGAELPKSVRVALLEIVRLSRNSLDQYNIYGARGFKKAFKRMLSELMEVYLEQGPENVKDKDWWKQALDHVKQIDAVAGRLLKYKPLLESLGTLLLGGGG